MDRAAGLFCRADDRLAQPTGRSGGVRADRVVRAPQPMDFQFRRSRDTYRGPVPGDLAVRRGAFARPTTRRHVLVSAAASAMAAAVDAVTAVVDLSRGGAGQTERQRVAAG